jgi:GT2 family glycosyltransferase
MVTVPNSSSTRNDILASVVLPAFNKAAALPLVLSDLFAVLNEHPDVEVIAVDDGSTDATASVAGQYSCRLLRHDVNQGKGAALDPTVTPIIWRRFQQLTQCVCETACA